MLKTKFVKFLSMALTVVVLCICVSGCANDSYDKWALVFGDNAIELPCSLADFQKAGLSITNEEQYNHIISSENEIFTAVEMTEANGEVNPYYTAVIVTGNDSSKTDENAQVVSFTTSESDADKCSLGGKIASGAKFDDVVEILGNDYAIVYTEAESDDEIEGFAVIKYEDNGTTAFLHFENKVLTTIQIETRDNG